MPYCAPSPSAICAIAPLAAADPPKFEVASVKRVDCVTIHNSIDAGMVALKGDPLKIVLMEAFQVKAFQIEGPSWLDQDCFDIAAKIPEGVGRDQVPAMLQALLAERLKLAAHMEDRPQSVYALVVDKGGPKLKEASTNFQRMGSNGQLRLFRAGNARGTKGAMTMALLAGFLSNSLDRPVKDFTGLTGTYDIDISWAPDPTVDRPSPASDDMLARAKAAGVELPPAPTATVFSALKDSLGLEVGDPQRAGASSGDRPRGAGTHRELTSPAQSFSMKSAKEAAPPRMATQPHFRRPGRLHHM